MTSNVFHYILGHVTAKLQKSNETWFYAKTRGNQGNSKAFIKEATSLTC